MHNYNMMAGRYIQRSLEPVLRRAVAEFPAVMITGPRQSGKTTLLRHLFGDDYRYVSLDLPDVRGAASGDPRGFVDHYRPPVIFDEVQYAPDVLPYIRERIDADRDHAGQYLLTGSQNLSLAETISESLAGRAAVLRLLPMSQRELMGTPARELPWERAAADDTAASTRPDDWWRAFLRGSYPEIAADPDRDAGTWQASYVRTYVERDVRTMRQVGDLTQFQNFTRALAARSGQLLNITDLARDLGVAVNTAKAWLSVLEATFQVIVLRPYHANVGKRLVKTPKVYFTDVGTLCYLTGLKDPEHAAAGPMAGAIMETAVLTEIYKTITHRGRDPRLHFWRTSSGREVDIIVETGQDLVPIEVKVSATPKRAMAASIRVFRHDLGDRVLPGYVIHPGDVRLPLGDGVTALPLREL